MYELMVAAKMLLTAPQHFVGAERAAIESRFGAPASVGTDTVPDRAGTGVADHVVTLDWPDLRVRLYAVTSTGAMSLIGVTVTKDIVPTDSPVHVGADRGTVLRELGPPAYEDDRQVVYSLQQESAALPNDTVRFVFVDDRVVGIDWTYPLWQGPEAAQISSSK